MDGASCSRRRSRRLSWKQTTTSDDVPCTHCGITYWCDGDEMLLCDGLGCSNAYHLRCVRPILHSVPNSPKWLCPACASTEQLPSPRSAKDLPDDDMSVTCEKCHLRWWGEGNEIILCGKYDSHGCRWGCHLKCHRPRLYQVPKDEWLCAAHAAGEASEAQTRHRRLLDLSPQPDDGCASPNRAWLQGHSRCDGKACWSSGCMNECTVCGQWFSQDGFIEHTKYNVSIKPVEDERLAPNEMANCLVEWEPGYPGYPGLAKHAYLRVNTTSCRQLRSTPPCEARSMLRQHGVWFNSTMFRGRLGPLLDIAKRQEMRLQQEKVDFYTYDYYADGLTRASDLIDADGVDYRPYLTTLKEHASFLLKEIFPELTVTYQEGHDKEHQTGLVKGDAKGFVQDSVTGGVRFFRGSYHTALHADHTLQHRLVGYDPTECTLLTVWVAIAELREARDGLCFFLPKDETSPLQDGTVACMVNVQPGACAVFLETIPHFSPKEQCWRRFPKGFRASVDMRFVISPIGQAVYIGSELMKELASDDPAIRDCPYCMVPRARPPRWMDPRETWLFRQETMPNFGLNSCKRRRKA